MPCCVQTITATGVAVTATEITITIPETTLVSGQRYRIYAPQAIGGGDGLPVLVANGAATVPLWSCGDARAVLGYQLACMSFKQCCALQHCIPVEYVDTGVDTNPAHFTVTRRLPTPCVN